MISFFSLFTFVFFLSIFLPSTFLGTRVQAATSLVYSQYPIYKGKLKAIFASGSYDL